MSDGSGSTTWAYANYGRTVTETRAVDGAPGNFVTSTTTDWLGRPWTLALPTGETLTYTYNA